MEEPQQQEAQASFQCMDPDLSAVLGWELLLKITKPMDTAGRSSWRLVSKAARQAVYDSATALAPCKIANSTTALLPQLLEKCSGVKQLSCAGLPGLNSIAGLMQLPLRLEALDISNTDVRDLSFIARCTSLRRLVATDVPGCKRRESRQLAAVLQQLPGLTALKLRYNDLDVDAARDVAAVLQNLTDLEELDIGGACPKAAAALLPALPRLKGLQLEELGLSDNGIRDEGVSALAPAIQQLTGLRTLYLRDNGFGLAGAQALAPALLHLSRLQELNLSSNDIGPEGAALLAPSVQELRGLLHLHLNSVNQGSEGAAFPAALAPALQRLTMLQRLDLGDNALGPEGMQALLPSIQQLVSLRSLNLKYNDLDREETLLFAAGIHQLSRLQVLDLTIGHFFVDGLEDGFRLALAHIIHKSSPACKVICGKL